MFFVGAFSGNLLYLVLAISSLAGCSAMVFRSSESQLKALNASGNCMAHVLYNNQFTDSPAFYYTKITDHSDHVLSAENSVMPPVIPIFETLFIPPLLSDMSRFCGSPVFSRPPPFSLT